ncbi:hypothetical protein M885DRAFT_510450 [Pelagophyceae sp. CCMP2097]|nr:hypothetical protein M885DRAFT_510450 [Pelagophyceae sp. CCMP2097]
MSGAESTGPASGRGTNGDGLSGLNTNGASTDGASGHGSSGLGHLLPALHLQESRRKLQHVRDSLTKSLHRAIPRPAPKEGHGKLGPMNVIEKRWAKSVRRVAECALLGLPLWFLLLRCGAWPWLPRGLFTLLLLLVYLEVPTLCGWILTRIGRLAVPSFGVVIGSAEVGAHLDHGETVANMWKLQDSGRRRLVFGVTLHDCYMHTSKQLENVYTHDSVMACKRCSFEVSFALDCGAMVASLRKLYKAATAKKEHARECRAGKPKKRLLWRSKSRESPGREVRESLGRESGGRESMTRESLPGDVREDEPDCEPRGVCLTIDSMRVHGARYWLEMARGELNVRRYDRANADRACSRAGRLGKNHGVPNMTDIRVRAYTRGTVYDCSSAVHAQVDADAASLDGTMDAPMPSKVSPLVYPTVSVALRDDRSHTAAREGVALSGCCAWDETYLFVSPDLAAVLHLVVHDSATHQLLGRFDARLYKLAIIAANGARDKARAGEARHGGSAMITLAPAVCDANGLARGARVYCMPGEARPLRDAASMLYDGRPRGCWVLEAKLKLRDALNVPNGSTLNVRIRLFRSVLSPSATDLAARRKETALHQFRVRRSEQRLCRASKQDFEEKARKALLRFDVRRCVVTDTQGEISDIFAGAVGMGERRRSCDGLDAQRGAVGSESSLIQYVDFGDALRSHHHHYTCPNVGLSAHELERVMEHQLLDRMFKSGVKVALNAAVQGFAARVAERLPFSRCVNSAMERQALVPEAQSPGGDDAANVNAEVEADVADADGEGQEEHHTQWRFYDGHDISEQPSRKLLQARSKVWRMIVGSPSRYFDCGDSRRICDDVDRGREAAVEGLLYKKHMYRHHRVHRAPQLMYVSLRGPMLYYTRRYCTNPLKLYGTTCLGFTKKLDLRDYAFGAHDGDRIRLKICKRATHTFELAAVLAGSTDLDAWWAAIEPQLARGNAHDSPQPAGRSRPSDE